MEELLALPVLTLNLEFGDTEHRVCNTSPIDRYKLCTQPNTGSEGIPGFGLLEMNVSILVLPEDIERDWWGAPESYWMRQKIRRAIKLGYEFSPIDYSDHLDEIREINTSKDMRQGLKMSDSYQAMPVKKNPFRNQTCRRHRNDYFGILKDGRLYAYALVRQCGEMFIFSEIIGHGDHLDTGIMNLMVFEAAKRRFAESECRYGVYHVHHNGTPGLQFFKRKMGFAGYRVHWELARPGVEVPAIEV
jgi:hypothetical protein